MNRQEYADFLNYNLFANKHIDFHAFMELFKNKYGEYPGHDYVITYNNKFQDVWYTNIERYFPDEE